MAQKNNLPKIIHFTKVPTTQNVALSYLELAKKEDLLVIAEEQTASIGRKKNRWFSPKNGWWGTFVFSIKQKLNAKQLTFLHYAIGLGAQEALEKITSTNIYLKWPNDLILSGKKLGGILIDKIEGEDVTFLLIGIGINTNNKVSILDPPVNYLAISIFESLGIKIDHDNFTELLYQHIKSYLTEIINEQYTMILKKFNLNNILSNKKISFKNKNYEVLGINEEGLLTIENKDQKEQKSLNIEMSDLIQIV